MIAAADVLHLPLPDASVDLVFGSPPYEDSRTYGICFRLRGQDWVDWAVAGFIECLRVSRGLVAWVIGHGKRRGYRWSATPSLFEADLHRRGVNLRDPVWFHRVGIPGSGGPDWLRQDVERIVCATARPGRLPWSDNTACGHPPKWAPGGEMSYRLSDGKRRTQWGGAVKSSANRRPDGSRDDGQRPSHRVLTKSGSRRGKNDEQKLHGYTLPAIANPGSLISLAVGGGMMGHALSHENEAPFPLDLAEFFVKSFCPVNGLVCDPFSGSGTTAHAALAHGRRFVACDIRESQCQLTRRRLQGVQRELI